MSGLGRQFFGGIEVFVLVFGGAHKQGYCSPWSTQESSALLIKEKDGVSDDKVNCEEVDCIDIGEDNFSSLAGPLFIL